MDTTKILLLVFLYLPVVLAGGFIARRKGDYFSRGAAISAITWILGLIFLIMAPPSKARAGDENDLYNWHIHSSMGALILLACIILYAIYYFTR